MNRFINHLKNKLLKKDSIKKYILLYILIFLIGIYLLVYITSLPLREIYLNILPIIFMIVTFMSAFFSKSYLVIFLIFLLLFGPIGAIRIGGKTPNIFYEDFYLISLFLLFITIWLGNKKNKFIVSNYAPWIVCFLGITAISLFITPDLYRGIGNFK